MGSTVLEFYGRHKNPRASALGIFIYVLRIRNPVDPLASASNLLFSVLGAYPGYWVLAMCKH